MVFFEQIEIEAALQQALTSLITETNCNESFSEEDKIMYVSILNADLENTTEWIMELENDKYISKYVYTFMELTEYIRALVWKAYFLH